MAQSTVNLGKVSIVLKGEWLNSTTYSTLDVVFLSGNSYISLVDNNLNHVVSDTNYWQMIAEKGDAGTTLHANLTDKNSEAAFQHVTTSQIEYWNQIGDISTALDIINGEVIQ